MFLDIDSQENSLITYKRRTNIFAIGGILTFVVMFLFVNYAIIIFPSAVANRWRDNFDNCPRCMESTLCEPKLVTKCKYDRLLIHGKYYRCGDVYNKVPVCNELGILRCPFGYKKIDGECKLE